MLANLSVKFLQRRTRKSTVGKVLAGVALVGAILIFYLNGHGTLTKAVQSYGVFAIVLSILAVGLFSMLPVPTESLLILNVTLYGVGGGLLYTWLGSLLGATLIYVLTRKGGRNLFRKFVGSSVYERANHWIDNKGILGLLMVRLLPLPACISNYAIGCMAAVKAWDYFWTAGISVLPYYLGTLATLGAFGSGMMQWLGLFVGLFVFGMGYLFSRRRKDF